LLASAGFAAGRDENRRVIVPRRPAGAEDRQHFVRQASEESFLAGLGGKRRLPGGGRCDRPWLVGVGLRN
jgi:hypothetical protein